MNQQYLKAHMMQIRTIRRNREMARIQDQQQLPVHPNQQPRQGVQDQAVPPPPQQIIYIHHHQ